MLIFVIKLAVSTARQVRYAHHILHTLNWTMVYDSFYLARVLKKVDVLSISGYKTIQCSDTVYLFMVSFPVHNFTYFYQFRVKRNIFLLTEKEIFKFYYFSQDIFSYYFVLRI